MNKPGECLGDVALLYDTHARTSALVVSEKAVLWSLERKDYQAVQVAAKINSIVDCLRSLRALRSGQFCLYLRFGLCFTSRSICWDSIRDFMSSTTAIYLIPTYGAFVRLLTPLVLCLCSLVPQEELPRFAMVVAEKRIASGTYVYTRGQTDERM